MLNTDAALIFVSYMLGSVQPLRKLPPNLPAGIHHVRLPDRVIRVPLRACVAGFHFPSINHYTQENHDESSASVF